MYGEKLKLFRELRNFTQDFVAQELDITQGAYSNYETNQTKLSAEMLKKVAAVLGVSPVDILSSQPTIVNFDSTIHGQGISQVDNFYTFQREFVEKMIASKDEQIKALQDTISTLRTTIENLTKNKN
jgi:transcriptional regulator with XRE-family HTH domain